MKACLRPFFLVLLVLGLPGCYLASALIVDRNDEQIAQDWAGDYYRFDDLPASISDWRSYRDKWAARYEIKRDPHLGEYFVVSESRDAPSTPLPTISGIVRVERLQHSSVVAQLFYGESHTGILALRRDTDGVIRTMEISPADEPGLRTRHGIMMQGNTLPNAQLLAASGRLDRKMVRGFLAEGASLPGTTWPVLLVPTRLVDQ